MSAITIQAPPARTPTPLPAVIPELDGIRGLAILLVMLYHFGTQPPNSAAGRVLFHCLDIGWAGVDVFFVLSGFLITGVLLDSRNASNYFSAFYARRALRIFPLYLVAVLFFFAIGLPVAKSRGLLDAVPAGEQWWFLLYLANFRSAFGVNHGPMTHFWSLAIEEQFYLVWPAVVFLLRGRALLAASFGLAGVSFLARLAWSPSAYGPDFLYRLTPFRVEPLVLGAAAAVLIRHPAWRARTSRLLAPLAALGVALIGLAIAITGSSTNNAPAITTFGYSGIALAVFALTFRCAERTGGTGLAERAMRAGWLRALGKYSYGIYVLHLPIAYAVILAIRRLGVEDSFPAALLAIAVGLPLSYAAALVSWMLLEKRCNALKSAFPYRRSA